MGCLFSSQNEMDDIHSSIISQQSEILSVHDKYKAKHKTVIKVKHKKNGSYNGKYTIHDYNCCKDGRPLIKTCNHSIDKPFDNKSHKLITKFKDRKGNSVGSIEAFRYLSDNDHLNEMKKWNIKNAKGHTMAILDWDTPNIPIAKSKCRFYVRSPNTMKTYYTIQGTFWEHKFMIRDGDNVAIAKSCRQMISSGYHRYGIELAKGIDYAVISMIMIAIDQFGLFHNIMWL